MCQAKLLEMEKEKRPETTGETDQRREDEYSHGGKHKTARQARKWFKPQMSHSACLNPKLAEDGKIFGLNQRNRRKSVEKCFVSLVSFHMTLFHTFTC